MELRQLRYAEAVVRHRHFTRAAEELHVAQSALSHQIRRLEAELGTELFERTSRRVVPTEAGEIVAVRARGILADVEGVHTEIDELRGLMHGRVSIGALLPAGPIDVPSLLVRFSEDHPGIDVDLHEGTAGDMQRYLADGDVDAAFSLLAEEPPESLVVERLGEEEVVAAFPPGLGPRGRTASASELAGGALVTPRSGSAIKQAVDEFFAAAGEPYHVTLDSGDPFLLRCLVSEGFGAAILPRSITERAGPPLEIRRLRPPILLPVALLWRGDRHLSPAARAFVEFVSRSAAR